MENTTYFYSCIVKAKKVDLVEVEGRKVVTDARRVGRREERGRVDR
jgi:hypothetical protein